MTLLKFHDDGVLGNNKDILVLGDGIAANNEGFHLGLRQQKVMYGFYSSDTLGSQTLYYGKWYHITWTWTKANGIR